MKRAMTILGVALMAITLVATPALSGGGGGGGGACRGFGAGDTILMRDSCFEGVGHVVEAGTTITVENAGRDVHTFTAVDGSFDSGPLAPGETWELTVSDPGPINVYCTLHSSPRGDGMAGLLTVTGGPATADASDAGGFGTPLWLLAGGLIAAAGIVHGRRTSHAVDGRRRLPSADSMSS